MTRRTGFGKLIMLTTIAMAGGRTSPAADWSGALDAGASVAYLKNPTLTPDVDTYDELGQLTLGADTRAQTERSRFSLTPRFAALRYRHDKDLDINTGSLDAGYEDKLERGLWTVNVQALTDSTVTSELGSTGITGINRRHYSGVASSSYQYSMSERLSWQLRGSWSTNRYSNAKQFSLTDSDYTSVQAGPFWNLTEHVQTSLLLETDRTSPQNRSAQKDYSAFLQVRHTLSERYAWHASAGATRIDPGSSAKTTTTVFELGASRHAENVQWNLEIRRAVLPVGFGLLTRQDQASLSLTTRPSEHGTLSLTVTALRSDPVTTFFYLLPGIGVHLQLYSGATSENASAEWRLDLTPRWALSASYDLARAQAGRGRQWADGNQARLGILWQSART
ncbi:MAG: hypothetical protein JOZ67_12420 [Gammaproteobacteria bacterium]|nr:hypothetical protein [Gammaproteobacteria bacterium]MBV9695412.1 hypothetical protein [Gammaproteobacteria bacterium]